MVRYHFKYKLDLYEIWNNQSVSDKLKELLYEIMAKIETFIKKNAPGSLYGEYAKKEECWNTVKTNDFEIDLSILKEHLQSSVSATKRKRISDDEITKAEFEAALERIKSVHYQVWKSIKEWGENKNKFNKYLCDMANTISNKMRNNRQLTVIEIDNAHKILDMVTQEAPELFYDLDELKEKESKAGKYKPEMDLDLVKDIVKWDKRNKVLKDYEFCFMAALAEGSKSLNKINTSIAIQNLEKVKRKGFKK